MLAFRGRGPVPVFVAMTKSDVSVLPASGPPDARSPFARLNDLLANVKPGKPPIALSVGEPQHPIPNFVGPVLAAHLPEFGRYPANRGIDPFLAAAAAWLGRRFKLNRPVDPHSEVLVLNGTREGLFLGAITARQWVGKRSGRPAILIPNPFYAAYAAGAMAADCEAVYLPTTKETGFLPDLDALSDELLSRTVAFYLASPSNPQGAVADMKYLTRLCALARRFGFLIFADECYCEIYGSRATRGNAGSGRLGLCQCGGVPFAVETLEHARLARRFLRRRPAFPCALHRVAQRRRAAGAGARAACRHRRL